MRGTADDSASKVRTGWTRRRLRCWFHLSLALLSVVLAVLSSIASALVAQLGWLQVRVSERDLARTVDGSGRSTEFLQRTTVLLLQTSVGSIPARELAGMEFPGTNVLPYWAKGLVHHHQSTVNAYGLPFRSCAIVYYRDSLDAPWQVRGAWLGHSGTTGIFFPTIVIWPGLAANIAIFYVTGFVLVTSGRFLLAWSRWHRGRCVDCGYALPQGGRCSECGSVNQCARRGGA